MPSDTGRATAQQAGKDLAGDVALEAAQDLVLGLAFGSATSSGRSDRRSELGIQVVDLGLQSLPGTLLSRSCERPAPADVKQSPVLVRCSNRRPGAWRIPPSPPRAGVPRHRASAGVVARLKAMMQ